MRKILLIFLIPAMYLNAGEEGTFRYFFRDFKDVFSAPFKKTNLLPVTVFLCSGTGLFLIDDTIRTLADKNYEDASSADEVFTGFKLLGDAKYVFATASAIYLTGLLSDNEGIRELGVREVETLAFTGLVVITLKAALGRSRPGTEDGPFKYRPFCFKESSFSLPSGHTATAFAFSSALAHMYNKHWISILVYSCAAMTALSRIYHDKHWLSDTFFGAGISIGIARIISGLHREGQEQDRKLKLNAGVNSLALQFEF